MTSHPDYLKREFFMWISMDHHRRLHFSMQQPKFFIFFINNFFLCIVCSFMSVFLKGERESIKKSIFFHDNAIINFYSSTIVHSFDFIYEFPSAENNLWRNLLNKEIWEQLFGDIISSRLLNIYFKRCHVVDGGIEQIKKLFCLSLCDLHLSHIIETHLHLKITYLISSSRFNRLLSIN